MEFVKRCILVCLFCFCHTGILYAATPFDDFLGSRIDSGKWHGRDWNGLERVREVTGGKLISKIGCPVGDQGCGNSLQFADPNSINTIEAKVSITEASIVGDNINTLAQIHGSFYQEAGGYDVWAFLSLEYNGSGYGAFCGVMTSTGGKSYIFALPIQAGTEYLLKIDYDHVTQVFVFSVDSESHSITGEPRVGTSSSEYKALETNIFGDPNAGSGYLSATFDDVKVDNLPHDDFSMSPLSSTKWWSGEIVREIRDGQLQMNSQHTGTRRENNSIFMQSAQVTDYFQADVTINSDTVLTGDNTRCEIRLHGGYYNSKYDGSSGYDGFDGEILASVRIRRYSDGSFKPFAYVQRCEDASCNNGTELLNREFSCDVQLDTPVTLAIEKKGSTLVFSCDQDQFSLELPGTVYDPKNNFRELRSRVSADSAPGGYLRATVDNVYINKSSPWNLFMPAILTGARK